MRGSNVRSVWLAPMVIAAVSLLVAACGSANPGRTPSNLAEPPKDTTANAEAGLATSVFGLPFPAGTMVSLGSKGLHDDNFSSLPGGSAVILELAGLTGIVAWTRSGQSCGD